MKIAHDARERSRFRFNEAGSFDVADGGGASLAATQASTVIRGPSNAPATDCLPDIGDTNLYTEPWESHAASLG